MKIVIEKLKPFSTEITSECQRVISNMRNTGDTAKFVSGLDMMTEWCSTFGKTEMGRWAEVLNDCDSILEAALEEDQNGTFAVDRDESLEAPILSVLRFTSLLFENTFSRSIYASMERLIKLLDCRKMWVLVQVLRLLMIISKSSRFISQHITQEARSKLYTKLMAILEAWNGRLRILPVHEFCSENYTVSPTMLSIQIRSDVPGYTVNLDKSIIKSISEMSAAFSSITLDDAEKALANFKVRFAYSSKNLNERFYLVMARLIATSVFFYSRCLITEEWRLNSLANDRFIEYCCEIFRCEMAPKCHALMDAVKTEALKTLASVVFLEKDKKIQMIVDQLELRTYHGFLPSQIRSCIESLRTGRMDGGGDCSIAFVTSLFSLVYHIAGFEYGGDALNRSSMTAVLLDVVKNYTLSEQNISFVTRSVRIIDNLTGMEITEFNARSGTDTVIKRLIHEVNKCKEHMLSRSSLSSSFAGSLLCNQQRSALMKSLLNFLKRAVVDVHLAGQMRRIMDTELPISLTHVVEHPHYYGPSLLHCAVTLTTNFIFQEPAQLTTLQNKGLTTAIMGLIFNEKFPISRDLVCALPNVCSALCLNERGLNELKLFNEKKPLEKMFRIIFSNKFLQSMRKRKIEIIETAHMLGTSFDELIRHHPSLRKDFMSTLAAICDDWLSFEQNCEREGKQCAISWAVGKAVVEDDTALLLPLGDFSTMMGIMLETMLTNRGVQDNVNVANEFDISLRLVKLITQAKQPNPVIMQSNYLHMLANILRYTHKNDMDKAFLHLIERSNAELCAYKQCETVADVNSPPRLCQLTRLCALLMTLNSLLKSSMHSQGTHEMRPYMLKYFATDPKACAFIYALFDAYKVIGTDRLVISCNAAEQQATTSQIAEDTAKVRELLIDDGSSSSNQHGATSSSTRTTTAAAVATPMEVDNNFGATAAALFDNGRGMTPSALFDSFRNSLMRPSADYVINATGGINTVLRSNSSGSAGATNHAHANGRGSVGTMMRSSSSSATTIVPTASGAQTMTMSSAGVDGGRLVERSTHTIAIRTLKQIAELITYIGKAFCTVTLPRVRQRANAPAPMDQAMVRRHAQKVTKIMFTGLKRLLEMDTVDEGSSLTKMSSTGLSSSHIHHSLSTLKKLLIDDTHNLALLLPYFYKTGCHNAFFALGDFLRQNVDKLEFNMPIQVWLGITQRLIAVQLQDITNASKNNNGTQQQTKQQPTILVEGFEPNNYLANFHKDAFVALINMFKSLVQQLSPPSSSDSIKPMVDNKEQEMFILLERVLSSIKILIQGALELLELVEGKAENSAEIPVGEIDTAKIEQLVEMGFSQSDAVDALMQYSTVHEAAEYIVSMLERPIAAASRPPVTVAAQPPNTVSLSSSGADTIPPTTVSAATAVATDLVDAATEAVVTDANAVATAAADLTTTDDDDDDTNSNTAQHQEQQQQQDDAIPAGGGTTQTEQQQQLQQLSASLASVQQRNQQAADAVEQLLQALRGEGVPPNSEMTTAVDAEAEQDDLLSFDELKPLKREEFQDIVDMLCKEVVDTCLRLVRRSRLVVLGLTDLVSVFVSDPLASSWVDGKFIGNIIAELNQHLDELTQQKATNSTTTYDHPALVLTVSSDEDSRNNDDSSSNELVEQLTSLLQLFCQLWQHFPNLKIFKRVDEGHNEEMAQK